MLATASIHKYSTKKGTRYCVRYRQDGKQRHETVPGYGKEAKEIARERAREIELGRHYEAPAQTLGAFLGHAPPPGWRGKPKTWLERRANEVKPVTLEREESALRALGALSEEDR